MKLRGLETGGLYYLDASQIQHKLGMTAMIYEINDDKNLKDTEEETKNNRYDNNPNSKGKSVQVMNRKEAHEKWLHQ